MRDRAGASPFGVMGEVVPDVGEEFLEVDETRQTLVDSVVEPEEEKGGWKVLQQVPTDEIGTYRCV